MRLVPFATFAVDVLLVSSVMAQTTAPGSVPDTATGGVADWWWIILVVVAAGAAVWYFTKGRTRV